MTRRNALVLTQAPHATYRGATACGPQYWLRPSQHVPYGPRIDAVVAALAQGGYAPILAEVSGGLVTQKDPGSGAAYKIVDWTPHNAFDPATQQLVHGGMRKRNKVIVYSDVTGEWREEAMPAGCAGVIAFNHWYGRTAGDAAGRRVFLAGWTYRTDTAETEVWSARPNSGSNGATASYTWFPEALSGAGGLMYHGGDWQRIQVYNPGTDTWDYAGSTPTGHSLHALLCYHPAHGKALLAGGTTTARRATLVDADGGFARVADAPADAHMEATGNGALLAHPSGCWLLVSNTPAPRQAWAYWPKADVWTAAGAMPDAGNVNATYAWDGARGVFYVLGEAGLYAWRPPLLDSPVVDLSVGGAGAVGIPCQAETVLVNEVDLTAVGWAGADGGFCRAGIVAVSVVDLSAAGGARAEGVSGSVGNIVTERVDLSACEVVARGFRGWSGSVYQTYGSGAYFAEDYVGVVADCALLSPPRVAKAVGVRANLGEGLALACAGAVARGVRASISESVFFGYGLAHALGVRASADDKVSCTVGAARAHGIRARVDQCTDVLLSSGVAGAFGVQAIAADGVLFGVGACEAWGFNAPAFAEEVVFIEARAGMAAGVSVPVRVSEGTEIGCQPGVAQSLGLDLEIGTGVALLCGTAATASIPTGITAYTRGIPLNARITLSYAHPVVASIT